MNISGACHITSSFFSMEGRLDFEGVQEATSAKQTIRYHSCIVAFFLRLFCYKTVKVKDIDGQVYYLNHGSLSNWFAKNSKEYKNKGKEYFNEAPEVWMQAQLDAVLRNKSPDYIVRIADLKFKLAQAERWKSSTNDGQKIADIKNQLKQAEAERLKNRA